MSFFNRNLALVSASWNTDVGREWSYRNEDEDDFATVTATDYFIDAFGKLVSGDRITVRTRINTYTVTINKSGELPIDAIVTANLSAGGSLIQTFFEVDGSPSSKYVAIPTSYGGTIVAISGILSGAITILDTIVQVRNNDNFVGQLVLPIAGSGAGVQSTILISNFPNNVITTIAPGSAIKFESSNSSGVAATAFISVLII